MLIYTIKINAIIIIKLVVYWESCACFFKFEIIKLFSDFLTLIFCLKSDSRCFFYQCSINQFIFSIVLAYAENSAFLDIHFCVISRFLLYEKFENSISSLLQLLNLLKIEAIQISLFVDILVIIFIQNVSTLKLKSISR